MKKEKREEDAAPRIWHSGDDGDTGRKSERSKQKPVNSDLLLLLSPRRMKKRFFDPFPFRQDKRISRLDLLTVIIIQWTHFLPPALKVNTLMYACVLQRIYSLHDFLLCLRKNISHPSSFKRQSVQQQNCKRN